MKKLLLLAFSCCIVLFSQAQFNKGSILVGGNINPILGFTKEGIYPHYISSINPSISIAIKDNKVWGAQYYYDHFTREKHGINRNLKSITHGAGIFYRQYIPIGKRLSFIGQANAFHTWQRFNYISSVNATIETKNLATGISLNTGVSFSITKNIHLETGFTNLSLSYNNSRTSETLAGNVFNSANRSWAFHPWPVLNIGFRFIIGTKKKPSIRKTHF